MIVYLYRLCLAEYAEDGHASRFLYFFKGCEGYSFRAAFQCTHEGSLYAHLRREHLLIHAPRFTEGSDCLANWELVFAVHLVHHFAARNDAMSLAICAVFVAAIALAPTYKFL